MDKHWNNFCTMSIVHFMAFPDTIGGEGPIVETVCKIAEDPFFDAIEIGWIKDAKVRANVRWIIETSHLKVNFGAQPTLLLQKLNLNSLDEDERKAAVNQMKANVDEAAAIGAQRVGFLSGKDPGDPDRPAALEALIKSVKEICAYGEDNGIGLTLETFDRDIDKACLIGPSDYAADFARAVRENYPSFGLMYDLSHMPLLREEALPALELLKDVLVHIHVGNCVAEPDTPGFGDLHPRFGWPGSANDVPELTGFIRALFKIGYLAETEDRPWVGFEVKPQTETERPEQLIVGSQRAWKEAWSRV